MDLHVAASWTAQERFNVLERTSPFSPLYSLLHLRTAHRRSWLQILLSFCACQPVLHALFSECWRQDEGDSCSPEETRARRAPLGKVACDTEPGACSGPSAQVGAPSVGRGASFRETAREPAFESPWTDWASVSRVWTARVTRSPRRARGAVGAWPIPRPPPLPEPSLLLPLPPGGRAASWARFHPRTLAPARGRAPGCPCALPTGPERSDRLFRAAALPEPGLPWPLCLPLSGRPGPLRAQSPCSAQVLHEAPCRCMASSVPQSLLGSTVLFTGLHSGLRGTTCAKSL